MKIISQLPLATLFFKHWLPDDREVGVVVAHAAFRRGSDGQFYAEDAPELRFEDRFTADAAVSPLEAEQDIAPAKLATDLIVHAMARSPDARLMTDWPVLVQIERQLHYEFRVRGPLMWRRDGPRGTWQADAPTPVNAVPVSYALAFGGTERDRNGDIASCFAENPAGRGYVTKPWLDWRRDPFDAPQIGLLADWMGRDPLVPLAVHGTGPIAKTWAPRRANAGTFDADWQRNRHPRMPHDYQMSYWNAAHRPLQITPFLTGTETIITEGLSALGRIEVALPHAALGLVADGDATLEHRLALDTVEMDLRPENPADHRLRLIWRAVIDAPDRFVSGSLIAITPLSSEAVP